jgi:hypothetical protein
MKKGDLVELSARGKKCQYLARLSDAHGIILKEPNLCYWSVKWFLDKGTLVVSVDRQHIKRLKTK